MSSKVIVSYMQMNAAPSAAPLKCPAENISMKLQRLDSQDYLRLYKEIGANYRWDTRLVITEEELAAILASPHTEIFVLSQDEEWIGLCEFDTSAFPEIEIKHFGIVERAHGKGIGRYFLDAVLRKLWERKPSRVWLHTDTDDHKNAVPTYERAGFVKYKEEAEA